MQEKYANNNLLRVLTLSLASLMMVGCTSSSPKNTVAPVESAPNNSWIAVSGTVIDTRDDAFTLDYGQGMITVEMDDWDWFPEGRQLFVDDQVIVYGYIDDDFLEKRTIEASSVYVKDLQTQFFASGVDEEDFHTLAVLDFRPRVELSGTVEKIEGREFQLDTGSGLIDVDTEDLGYNPVDDEGFQKLEVGDRVRVTGALSPDFFADLDLMADVIVTLKEASDKDEDKASQDT